MISLICSEILIVFSRIDFLLHFGYFIIQIIDFVLIPRRASRQSEDTVALLYRKFFKLYYKIKILCKKRGVMDFGYNVENYSENEVLTP